MTEPSQTATQYPKRLCHIDYTAHPYRCGCLKSDEASQGIYDEYFGAMAEPSAPTELSVAQPESE